MKNLLTVTDYWMGRDRLFPDYMTQQIAANARETVRRVNAFLVDFYGAVPQAVERRVVSGWRPPPVNAGTKGAARTSAHLTGEAVDLSDDEEVLDAWTNTAPGLAALEQYDLYAEDRGSTPRWTHLQTRRTSSGRRVFIP
jgi:hypothetical protein